VLTLTAEIIYLRLFAICLKQSVTVFYFQRNQEWEVVCNDIVTLLTIGTALLLLISKISYQTRIGVERIELSGRPKDKRKAYSKATTINPCGGKRRSSRGFYIHQQADYRDVVVHS
jgi:hypothetical protein